MKELQKPRYTNDRKAPRMKKGKYSKMVINKELHKKFIKEYPEYKDMSWKEFYEDWIDIAKQIRRETIFNPLGVKLGSYIGELKLQYLPYDFKAKDETSDGTPFLNLNMKGKVARIKWERRWAVKFNKILQFYAFDPVRELHALANKHIVNNPDRLRIARNTLGGHSVWRQKMNTNEYKKGINNIS